MGIEMIISIQIQSHQMPGNSTGTGTRYPNLLTHSLIHTSNYR